MPPYYKPYVPQGAYFFDSRKVSPSADFYAVPLEKDIYGAQTVSDVLTSYGVGGVMGKAGTNRIIVVDKDSNNTNLQVLDTSVSPWSVAQYNIGTPTFLGGGVVDSYDADVGLVNGYDLHIYSYDDVNHNLVYNNLNNLPVVRSNALFVKTLSGLYVVGGTASSNGYGSDSNTIYKLTGTYYPGSNTASNPGSWVSPWTSMTPPGVAVQQIGGCVDYNGYDIHIFHYTDSTGNPQNTHLVYHTLTDTWETFSNYPSSDSSYMLSLPNNQFLLPVPSTSNAMIWDANLNTSYTISSLTSKICHGFLNLDGEACALPATASTSNLLQFLRLNPYYRWAIDYAFQ